MARPFLIAQLSDPHVGAEWIEPKPADLFAAAVAAVRRLEPGPDAVIVSGDLVEDAQDSEYERVRELLEPFDVPVHVLPGNHDDRDALHRHFGVPGQAGSPCSTRPSSGRSGSSCSTAPFPGTTAGSSTPGAARVARGRAVGGSPSGPR